jgi:hypothetical protein
MYIESVVDIAAPRLHVWNVLIDVKRWSDWTPTVTRAERLDEGPLNVGSRTRIAQPKIPPAIWHVTELDETRGVFIWVARSPGVLTTASHLIAESPRGTRAALSLEFLGFAAILAIRLFGRLTEEYVDTEAESLKRWCEAPSPISRVF